MLHVAGTPLAPRDAFWLIERLYADGEGDAVAAAMAIEAGLDDELDAVALSPRQLDAILRQLEDPPESLGDLRGKLARNDREQTRE
jgi:hypothetical protein